MSAEVIKSAGASANGLLVEMQAYLPPKSDTSTPGVQQFRADMTAVGQDAEVDTNSASAWVAVDLFATAAKGLASITRATMLQALPTVSNYNAGGIIPTIDLTKAAPNPAYPRVFNVAFASAILQDGEFTPAKGIDKFIPFFKTAS